MANYEFHYEEDGEPLIVWIDEKINKTYKLNLAKREIPVVRGFQDLTAREFDLEPDVCRLYCRDPNAAVYFILNQTTGEIRTVYDSEQYGNKGGNPWWCIAEPRNAESTTCGEGPRKLTLLPASDPHGMSIVEYLQANILRRIPGRGNAPRANAVPRPRNNAWTNVPQNAGSRKKSGKRRSTRKQRRTRK